uniref:Nucleolar protein 58/56 N-terminal domain-containing protein n=1 Tax=Salix viminalis TaxID=40686 RepID=A0A6N2KU31_SALVM
MSTSHSEVFRGIERCFCYLRRRGALPFLKSWMKESYLKLRIWGRSFQAQTQARKVVKLKAFSKFENTAEALEAATKIIESSTSKGLRKILAC